MNLTTPNRKRTALIVTLIAAVTLPLILITGFFIYIQTPHGTGVTKTAEKLKFPDSWQEKTIVNTTNETCFAPDDPCPQIQKDYVPDTLLTKEAFQKELSQSGLAFTDVSLCSGNKTSYGTPLYRAKAKDGSSHVYVVYYISPGRTIPSVVKTFIQKQDVNPADYLC